MAASRVSTPFAATSRASSLAGYPLGDGSDSSPTVIVNSGASTWTTTGSDIGAAPPAGSDRSRSTSSISPGRPSAAACRRMASKVRRPSSRAPSASRIRPRRRRHRNEAGWAKIVVRLDSARSRYRRATSGWPLRTRVIPNSAAMMAAKGDSRGWAASSAAMRSKRSQCSWHQAVGPHVEPDLDRRQRRQPDEVAGAGGQVSGQLDGSARRGVVADRVLDGCQLGQPHGCIAVLGLGHPVGAQPHQRQRLRRAPDEQERLEVCGPGAVRERRPPDRLEEVHGCGDEVLATPDGDWVLGEEQAVPVQPQHLGCGRDVLGRPLLADGPLGMLAGQRFRDGRLTDLEQTEVGLHPVVAGEQGLRLQQSPRPFAGRPIDEPEESGLRDGVVGRRVHDGQPFGGRGRQELERERPARRRHAGDQRPHPRGTSVAQPVGRQLLDQRDGLLVPAFGQEQLGRELALVERVEGGRDRCHRRRIAFRLGQRVAQPFPGRPPSVDERHQRRVGPGKGLDGAEGLTQPGEQPRRKSRQPRQHGEQRARRRRQIGEDEVGERGHVASGHAVEAGSLRRRSVPAGPDGEPDRERPSSGPGHQGIVDACCGTDSPALVRIESELVGADGDRPTGGLGPDHGRRRLAAGADHQPAVGRKGVDGGPGHRIEDRDGEEMGVVDHDAPRPGQRLERGPEQRDRGGVVERHRPGVAEIGPHPAQRPEQLAHHAGTIPVELVGGEPRRRPPGRRRQLGGQAGFPVTRPVRSAPRRGRTAGGRADGDGRRRRAARAA